MDGEPTSHGILRAAAVASLLIGVLFVLGTWDWLYGTVLPQALPAIDAQMGGMALIALAYVLWAAASRPELARVAAGAGTIAMGGSAGVIAAWLIFRDRYDLRIDEAGIPILIVVAVILGALALLQARIAWGSRGSV